MFEDSKVEQSHASARRQNLFDDDVDESAAGVAAKGAGGEPLKAASQAVPSESKLELPSSSAARLSHHALVSRARGPRTQRRAQRRSIAVVEGRITRDEWHGPELRDDSAALGKPSARDASSVAEVAGPAAGLGALAGAALAQRGKLARGGMRPRGSAQARGGRGAMAERGRGGGARGAATMRTSAPATGRRPPPGGVALPMGGGFDPRAALAGLKKTGGATTTESAPARERPAQPRPAAGAASGALRSDKPSSSAEPPEPVKAKKPWKAPQTPLCKVCNKRVYVTEEIRIEEVPYHKVSAAIWLCFFLVLCVN